MRKLLIALFLFVSTLPSFAYKTEEMYIMRLLESGKLYFISENIFESVNSNLKLPFDITHLSTTDSVSIKMSVYNESLTSVDSVAILCGEHMYTCQNPAAIYKEKEKKLWVHRYDCKAPYTFVKQSLTGEFAPKIVIYTTDKTVTYTLSSNKWKKLSPHLREIFMIIDSSK